MKFTAPPKSAPPAEPAAGGSYVRNTDGSLTLVQQTQPAQGRALRDRTGIVMTSAPEGAAIAGDGTAHALPDASTDTPKE